jgi:hypothetical protein
VTDEFDTLDEFETLANETSERAALLAATLAEYRAGLQEIIDRLTMDLNASQESMKSPRERRVNDTWHSP